VIVDGARICYRRSGRGPALLLIHGLVGSSRNWRRNIHALGRHATVYAIDLLNMGDSERVSGLEPGLEVTARQVAGFMDAVGLEAANVAGHSYGGAIAMMLGILYPERVGSLILFAPANPFCNLGQQLIQFYQSPTGRWLARQIPWLPRSMKSIALGRMYGDPRRVPDDALDGYVDGLAVPGTVDHILRIVRGWHDEMSRLRSALPRLCDKPALLIWGDRDRAVGLESAKELRRFMPCSKLVVLPGAGHIPFEEMPEPCNVAVMNWLAGEYSATRSAA
jgi:pimeloyl-ACP methyl ester carboxylesterase